MMDILFFSSFLFFNEVFFSFVFKCPVKQKYTALHAEVDMLEFIYSTDWCKKCMCVKCLKKVSNLSGLCTHVV